MIRFYKGYWNKFSLVAQAATLHPDTIAPPSHPDTIVTTLTHMHRSLLDVGMAYVHLSVYMQLFVMTKQVCWHQQLHFQNVIVHPGGIHIIQLCIGCIAKLMNGSALDTYVATAYRGLTGIFNGKSWVKALSYVRACRDTVEALLFSRTEDIRGNRRVPGCCSSTS